MATPLFFKQVLAFAFFITLPDVRSQLSLSLQNKISVGLGLGAAEGCGITYKEVINLPR